jgi:hypothetical protein
MFTYLLSKGVFKLFKKPQTKWTFCKQLPRMLFAPHMTFDEYRLFKKTCASKKVILEYGSGGSTIYFLKHNKRVYSVENSPAFYAYMKSIGFIRKAMDKSLFYKFIDLGETHKWGKPISLNNQIDWPNYYSAVWDDIVKKETKVDVVFIDGRFRVQCCLYSILMIAEKKWNDTLILIHDFNKRKNYHVVLPFLDEIASTTSLFVFSVKKDISLDNVNHLLGQSAAKPE